MQEIKKVRIVLASLLKPVDDTRMFEKLGITLADSYEVTIIGQPTAAAPLNNTITFRPLPRFGRLSIKRLLAPLYVLRRVMAVRPGVLIVCSAELLPLALAVKIFAGAKLIYDIQENYALNILHGTAWPRLLRPLFAWMVRMVEWISSPFVSHYLLAEKSYARELRFIGRKFTLVENKLVRTGRPFARPGPNQATGTDRNVELRLLFTGTLAITTGVFEAIALAKQLHDADASIRLRVIGYAAMPDVRARLRTLAGELSFIQLDGIDHLVPHGEILEAIGWAHFGIISYPQNISTWSAFPTKLYEYVGYQLPILLTNNPAWVSFCQSYTAAVVFVPNQVVAHQLLAEMKQGIFYTKNTNDVFWDTEAPKVLEVVKRLTQ